MLSRRDWLCAPRAGVGVLALGGPACAVRRMQLPDPRSGTHQSDRQALTRTLAKLSDGEMQAVANYLAALR